MVYGPRSEHELESVVSFVEESVAFARADAAPVPAIVPL